MAEAERALIAAKEGDLQTLRSLRRSVPFAVDVYGATTLHYASRTGQLACTKWLVEAIGISPIARGKSGATPLHDAATQGQLHCVKYFLNSPVVDVETRDLSGHTALHLAARFGRFETVKWLIEHENCNARAKSRNHMTPIHFAASGGHLNCLELLVSEAGHGSVNDPATDGTTPLYLASQDGNLDCLKYLHSVGGKCNARARDGMLPIHGAAQNGQLDCVDYLIDSGQTEWDERDTTGATPAHYAAAQGHVNVLKWLNSKGEISTTDELGGSPLHDAAEQGQFECVRYLVENASLDVDQTDKEGLTPLALAMKSGHRRCIDYLKIAASKKAKAQKRQIKIQNNEDSYKSTKAIAGKQPTREYSGVNSTVISSTEMANPMHFTGDFDSNNNDTGSEVKIQAKRYFPSFSFAEEGSVVSKKLHNTSKQDRSAKTVGRITSSSLVGDIDVNNNVASNVRSTGNDFSNTGVTYSNIGSNHSKANNIRWRSNKVKRQERTEISDSISSSDSASVLLQTATFPLHSSQPRETTLLASSERVNPLRERQFQPLPHIDGVIPPPAEFSENLVFTRQ